MSSLPPTGGDRYGGHGGLAPTSAILKDLWVAQKLDLVDVEGLLGYLIDWLIAGDQGRRKASFVSQ